MASPFGCTQGHNKVSLRSVGGVKCSRKRFITKDELAAPSTADLRLTPESRIIYVGRQSRWLSVGTRLDAVVSVAMSDEHLKELDYENGFSGSVILYQHATKTGKRFNRRDR
ncbi:Unannotated [Lentimonas sp. CC19]|uniref:hypothetical protein n=1 Tax=Lentimonas sp. CC19 TaxID=2676097 RepID=UPI00132689F4|nr:hypothetical protein [Lentimonas sp. CC19]CAA6690050.1 Unannotated [Lentimonas sp. CC19]